MTESFSDPIWLGLVVPPGVSCSDTSDCAGKLVWEDGGALEHKVYMHGDIVVDNENHTECLAINVRAETPLSNNDPTI